MGFSLIGQIPYLVQQRLIELGIEQTFALRRTSIDNPYVESLFSTIKTSPVYPGWFPYDDEAVVQEYFERYFQWYNTEHYHSRIGYVTPVQKHTGQAERIIAEIAERKIQLTAQREHRKHYWLSQTNNRRRAVVI